MIEEIGYKSYTKANEGTNGARHDGTLLMFPHLGAGDKRISVSRSPVATWKVQGQSVLLKTCRKHNNNQKL